MDEQNTDLTTTKGAVIPNSLIIRAERARSGDKPGQELKWSPYLVGLVLADVKQAELENGWGAKEGAE